MKIVLREGPSNGEARIAIVSPQDIHTNVKEIKDSDNECFAVICLDSKNKMISSEVVSIGTLNSCASHAREIFRGAITRNAASVILSHNHPSGDVTPSLQDIAVTKKLVEAGTILDIRVLDHVIVSGDKFFSLREEYSVKF